MPEPGRGGVGWDGNFLFRDGEENSLDFHYEFSVKITVWVYEESTFQHWKTNLICVLRDLENSLEQEKLDIVLT